jgi:hypothetical protein
MASPKHPERLSFTMPPERQTRLKRYILDKRGGNFRITSAVINEWVEEKLKAEGY